MNRCDPFFLFRNYCLLAMTTWVISHSLTAQSPISRAGRDYAVFFFVTDFKPGWQKLPETAVEAALLKKELEDNFDFSCKAIANPTRQQILDEVKAWNERLQVDDQVLFFFSSHGHFDKPGNRGYLVPADGLDPRDDPYFGSWLSYDDLRTYLARCKARHILLALDACHSGSFGIRTKGAPDKPAFEEDGGCGVRRQTAFAYQSRQYLTSGNEEDRTPAKSLFAERFLEALRQAPSHDGLVFFDDLVYNLGKVTAPKPEGGTFGQHEAGGGFVLARKDACSGVNSKPNMVRQASLAPSEAPIEFVLVEGGTFKMGAGRGTSDAKPDHDVSVSSFYMSTYEITQTFWREVMGSDPPQLRFTGCNKCPVESVNWEDVQDFLQKLNKQTGQTYRLPTEAEWEYAAKGGRKSRDYIYAGSDDEVEVGWHQWNSSGQTHPVGQLLPNELGLYDMFGNVWEWCNDWYGKKYYAKSPFNNPPGPGFGTERVVRGASWASINQYGRSASRASYLPTERSSAVGFRLVKTLKQKN